MWGAFWANSGHASAKDLPLNSKLALMNRVCTPMLLHRCSRWPPQPTIAAELDRVQMKMVAVLLRVRRLEGEQPEVFCRRRNVLAKQACSGFSKWSQLWFQRAKAWDEHVIRAHNPYSWPSLLRLFHEADWLNERWLLSDSRGQRGTSTRLSSGRPPVRWHEGIAALPA